MNAPTLLPLYGLGSSPFARRYSGNRNFFLFLRVLRWFTSPGSPSPCGEYPPFQVDGLPHSEIPGSQVACTSPGLFAACHVLHRQVSPRHSLYALNSLTINFKLSMNKSTLLSGFILQARKIIILPFFILSRYITLFKSLCQEHLYFYIRRY